LQHFIINGGIISYIHLLLSRLTRDIAPGTTCTSTIIYGAKAKLVSPSSIGENL